jgi:protocatechuate 3,4-dioxygenase beta subunit
MSRRLRSLIIVTLAAAALPAGALTASQQQIEVVRTVAGAATTVTTGGTVMMPVQQTGTGILVGRVVDADGLTPVAAAEVTIGRTPAGMMRGGGGGGPMAFSGVSMSPAARGRGGDAEDVPRVLTDSNGRFAFRNLPAGALTITVQKPGYLEGAYGRLRPEGSSRPVELEEGERRDDVAIRLFRPAVITGRLVDDRNEPVVGADVRAYRRDLVSGRRVLSAESRSAVTDDRGVYRLSNLMPGEYVVAAPTVVQSAPASFQLEGGMPPDLLSTMMTPGNASFSYSSGGSPVGDGRFVVQSGGPSSSANAPDMAGRYLTYPTTYYPSASVASEAAPVAVASGEERGGVDIALGLLPTTTISGRLMGPDGPAANYALHLVPSDTGSLTADPDVARAITGEDGAFMFVGVPAGNYVIQTVRAPRSFPRAGGNVTMLQASAGTVAFAARQIETGRGGNVVRAEATEPAPTLWSSMPVSVGGTPVDGVALTLQEGLTVAGRVEFEGSAPPPAADELSRIAIVAEVVEGHRTVIPPRAQVLEDGRFEVTGLLPGRYVLRATNAGRDWTLKSVTLGGVDVADAPFGVDRDVAGLVVTFTDRPSSLQGVVRDGQGAPDAEAAVLLFPADSRQWIDYGSSSRRLRVARTSQTGSYALDALPAGDYYLIAIADESSGEWQDPRYLEQAALQASRFTVAEGTQHTQDLTTQPFSGVTGGTWPSYQPSVDAGDVADAAPAGHGPFVPDDDLIVPDEAPVVAAARQVRDTRVMAAAGTATISGRVVRDDGTDQPIRRARVSLRAADTRVDHAVMTDDDGRFMLSNLPAGRYSLTATKPAYVTTFYGSRRAGRGPGVPVALTDGAALDDVLLRMPRGAVVSGRVTDEFGQPMPDVGVRIVQRRDTRGRRAFVEGGLRSSTQTDDRGYYRIFGLMPGDYVAMVTPPRPRAEVRQLSAADVDAVLADVLREPGGSDHVPLGGRTVGFAPVYYPGTTAASSATRLTLASGQELDNIDIPVHRVPTARIDGTVTGPDGRPVPGTSLLLLPTGDEPVAFNVTSIVRTGPDGSFTATNIVPGRYRLAARSSGGRGGTQVIGVGGGGVFVSSRSWSSAAPGEAPAEPGPALPPLWAEALVDVNGQDLTDLALTMQAGMTISGRVVFEGDRPPPDDLTSIRVTVLPAEQDGITLGVPAGQVNADGVFTLEGVVPGAYRVNATVPSSGFSPDSAWQLQSAMSGGRDALDTHLEVQPGQPVDDLVMTFTDRRTELSGTVLDPSGAPVSDLTILVFAAHPQFWSPASRRLPQPQQPASDGQFRFTSLPPGDYLLAAVTELEDGDWGDPAFMEQVAAAAIPLTIGAGEKKVQDLRIGGGTQELASAPAPAVALGAPSAR